MTLRSRNRLFYALLAAFIVLGAGVILYVNGWRLDLTTFTASKVGGIFVQSVPRNAAITLDKKPISNNSGFFENGTLVNDLFPKTYDLQLSSPGYKPWTEKVQVAPSLVADERNAVLVPDSSTRAATGTIARFRLFDGQFITTPVKDTATGTLSLDLARIGSGDVLGWTNDFRNILSFNAANGDYSLFRVSATARTDVTTALAKAGVNAKKISDIMIDPYDGTNLLVVSPAAISLFDPVSLAFSRVKSAAPGTIFTLAAPSQFFFAWTTWNETANTSTLVIYDKFLGNIQSSAGSIHGKTAKLRWVANNTLALLEDDGSLYLYDTTNGTLAKIADDVKDFSFTADGSAAAALEENSLEVFFFTQDKEYYRFNLPDVRLAQSVDWYGDGMHLFVHYPDAVKFLDLKDGALENFTMVAKTPFASYDEKTNSLYYVGGNGIEKIVFPK
ncbi:MAG TPA: PEGA domain-containing protein [Candidatus Paceibacterota bacterium]|nr:PEGA domain-containing protein [Candidatus Paceibacterota bacterium]